MTTGTDQIRVPSDPRADEELIADFVTMSTFGATPAGGVERQAATAADGSNREWLSTWLSDRGFTVSYDRIGNQFGLFELVPGAPYVLAGSHLDSQPRGGKYDGAYGVLAAAHAMNRLRRYFEQHPKAAKFNLAVVNWFNEEGSRFKPSMQGSGVFTGKIPLETALTTTDSEGTTVGQALGELGMLGDNDVFTVGDHHTPGGLAAASYAEIHIEQGRELDKAGVTRASSTALGAQTNTRYRSSGLKHIPAPLRSPTARTRCTARLSPSWHSAIWPTGTGTTCTRRAAS